MLDNEIRLWPFVGGFLRADMSLCLYKIIRFFLYNKRNTDTKAMVVFSHIEFPPKILAFMCIDVFLICDDLFVLTTHGHCLFNV